MNENEKILEQNKEKENLTSTFTGITNPLQDRIQFDENTKEVIKNNASSIVDSVLKASYLDENEKLKEFSSFGKNEERSSDKMLMKNKTLANLDSNLVKSSLGDQLVDLRRTMSGITESHSSFEADGFMDKIKRKLFKNKIVADKVLKRQDTETVVSGIIGDLYKSRDILIKDNTMIENFEQSSKEEIFELQRQITFGNKVYEELNERKANGEFVGKEHLFDDAMSKTLMRTKLLNDKLLLLLQASETAKMIHKDNEKLITNIDEYSKSAESMMYISIFIADSLSSQKAALQGVNEVKGFINNLMIQNAEMLQSNAAEVDKFMSTGILDIETAKQSLAILTKTIEDQENSTKRIISESRKHIDEMTDLMSDINAKYVADEDKK